MNLQQMLEARARALTTMREVNDLAKGENRDFTAEETEKYNRAEADFDSLSDKIEREQKLTERGRQLSEEAPVNPAVTPPADEREDGADELAYRQAFIEYVRGGMSSLEPEQRKALRAGFVPEKESRAQAVGTNSAGGYLVPQGFRAQIVETMKDYGVVRNVAQVITTDTGATLPWPTNDDTASVGALLAENTQATELDLTLGQASLGAYKYTSKIVRASVEFLQDVSWMDAEAFLARKLGERVARIENQHQTTGTGTAQPEGIVTGAVSGKTAAAVADITADELIDLVHSVDPAYRRNGRARFMLSDTALAKIRKLKDANDQYLWQPNFQDGVAANLLGYPYEVNQDMAVPATGVKSVLFGDFFAGYIIRQVRDFQLIRMDERYADYLQVGFIGFSRMDAAPQDTAAYKALTQA